MAETGLRTEEEKDAVFNLGNRRLSVAGKLPGLTLEWEGARAC